MTIGHPVHGTEQGNIRLIEGATCICFRASRIVSYWQLKIKTIIISLYSLSNYI